MENSNNNLSRPITIDLFAGAGGFTLGFSLAGYKSAVALEIDAWAADTLRENHSTIKVIQDDIRTYRTADEIKAVCNIQPHVIIGGPPCQGFSIAGPAQKDPRDPRNSLFVDFARWVEVFNPQIFVMENVKGLLSRNNANGEKVIEIIKKAFINLGYSVEVWILNAAEYGVPQIRERIFIVGNRLGISQIGAPPKTHVVKKGQNNQTGQPKLFETAESKPAISVWDAISDLPELNAGEGEEEQDYTDVPRTEYQVWVRGGQEILYNHVAMNHSARMVERFKRVGLGESGADVPKEYGARRRNGNGDLSEKKYDQNNRRLYPHKPSHTIAASFYANFIHPFQHRNLTAREGARLQSFPDSYRFIGQKTVVSHRLLQREGRFEEIHLCQYNQIGNAVPPLLAKAIAQHLRKVIEI
jgi:DNA (cytosine-5)-methyltransferase 1